MLDRQPSPLADAARRAAVGQAPKGKVNPALPTIRQDRRRTLRDGNDFGFLENAPRIAAAWASVPDEPWPSSAEIREYPVG